MITILSALASLLSFRVRSRASMELEARRLAKSGDRFCVSLPVGEKKAPEFSQIPAPKCAA